ncbi:MAG: ribbon-helix-helix protein, CopG family [Dehalococcoidia bacterium]|nr:ribbon-helix-helix protein, CopG family [Dehalococcoidia bacterium]
MRMTVDLDEMQAAALVSVCEADGVSHEDAIRRAIDGYVSERQGAHWAEAKAAAFGTWKDRDFDALDDERELREEWEPRDRDAEWEELKRASFGMLRDNPIDLEALRSEIWGGAEWDLTEEQLAELDRIRESDGISRPEAIRQAVDLFIAARNAGDWERSAARSFGIWKDNPRDALAWEDELRGEAER